MVSPLSGSNQAVSTPLSNVGTGAQEGGVINQQRDSKEAATAPKFGDVYQQIQAKYGEKAEKPREIKKTLGKDDFLKIMITQMKNQDPTNPFKAEQMATEVAQFTSVEQLQNVNQNLNKMTNQNKPLEQMAMTNLIGKTVTIDRERFPHTEGQSESLRFNLPKDAANVHVALISEAGEVVIEKDLGNQKAGEVSFPWDGKKSNTLSAKGGNYMLRVEAKDDRGQSIETNPQAQSRIIGVSFEGTEPVFLVGDAKHQEKITMRNIVKVEMDVGAAPKNQAAVQPVNTNQSKTPNFFSFQKGVGSSTINGNQPQAGVKPEAIQALESFQDKGQEKGFPNGLKDPDEPSQTVVSKGGEVK